MIKMTEIRKLTTQELNKKLEENKKELFKIFCINWNFRKTS